MDKEGNHRTDGGDKFDVSINGPDGNLSSEIVDNSNGTYDVTFYPENPGKYTLDVRYRDESVKDCPVELNCIEVRFQIFMEASRRHHLTWLVVTGY